MFRKRTEDVRRTLFHKMHVTAARGINESTTGMEAATAAIAVNPEAIGLGKQRTGAELTVELLQAAGAARDRCSRGFCRRKSSLNAKRGRSSATCPQQEHRWPPDCRQRFALQQLLQRRRR